MLPTAICPTGPWWLHPAPQLLLAYPALQAVGGGVTQVLPDWYQEPNVHVPFAVLQDIVRACVIEPVCPLGHETV